MSLRVRLVRLLTPALLVLIPSLLPIPGEFLSITAQAQTSQDPKAEADGLLEQGNQQFQRSQYKAAIHSWQQALEIYQELRDRNGESASLNNLGNAYNSLGQYAKAIEFFQQSLVISRDIGDRNGESASLNNLGNAYYSLEQYAKAIEFFQQSLVISRDIGDREGEGVILANIGSTLEKQKQSELAIVFYKQSVNVRESIRQDIRKLPREQQESYTQTVAGSYRRLADLLLSQGRVLEAQQVIDHRILHIATHAQFISQNPDDSFLLLGDGNSFKIREVKNLTDLGGIHLVVLSAYETARGGEDKEGIEVSGLSYYFLTSAAKSVIASLWLVNDGSTSKLMRYFYQNLATGKMKTEALRQAQLTMIAGKNQNSDTKDRSSVIFTPGNSGQAASISRNFSHPYYWTPFILIGNGL